MARTLWIIVAVLLVLWLAGTVIGFLGDVIHLVLVAAIVLAVLGFVRRKI